MALFHVKHDEPGRGAAVPDPPPAASLVFGDRLELANRYASLLASEALPRGLLGPRELPRLWDRHLLNCAVVQELLPSAARVCDLGSGAGLPGLVLAIARPDLRMTLLEPLLRRCIFLTAAVERLGCDNVVVERARAEEATSGDYDAVVARAVAPLARLAGWALPLLRDQGELLALKGAGAAEELREVGDRLPNLGGATPRIKHVGGDYVNPPTTVVCVRRAPRLAPRRQQGSAPAVPAGAPTGGTGGPRARQEPERRQGKRT